MFRRALLIALAATVIGLIIGGASVTSAGGPGPSEQIGYLKIDGLLGEVQDDGFDGALVVRSFDFHVTNSGGSGGGGGGGGGGKPVVRALDVVVDMDKASPGLLRRLVLGTHFSKVTLSLARGIGEEPLVYKRYILTDSTLDSMHERLSDAAGEIPSIQLSFAPRRLNVEYDFHNPKGQVIETTKFCFNYITNIQC